MPFEQQRVARGVGQNYGNKGVGGFHQYDIQDIARPKTVDELRVLSNPKTTYKQPVLSGKGINQERTAMPNVQKYKPETAFELGSERWFTTKGAVTGNTQRPEQVLKNTKR